MMFSTIKYTILISFISIHLGYAQGNCACCTSDHDAFDFWIGEWDVYDPSGEKVGENTITNLEDNCIINEQWVGTSGTTGRSYNYYDKTDNTWNQLWIDNSGNHLKLKGIAGTNKMVLRSKMITNAQGDYFYNKVTWTKNNDGSVRQIWELMSKKDTLLQVAFDGLYKPKNQ